MRFLGLVLFFSFVISSCLGEGGSNDSKSASQEGEVRVEPDQNTELAVSGSEGSKVTLPPGTFSVPVNAKVDSVNPSTISLSIPEGSDVSPDAVPLAAINIAVTDVTGKPISQDKILQPGTVLLSTDFGNALRLTGGGSIDPLSVNILKINGFGTDQPIQTFLGRAVAALTVSGSRVDVEFNIRDFNALYVLIARVRTSNSAVSSLGTPGSNPIITSADGSFIDLTTGGFETGSIAEMTTETVSANTGVITTDGVEAKKVFRLSLTDRFGNLVTSDKISTPQPVTIFFDSTAFGLTAVESINISHIKILRIIDGVETYLDAGAYTLTKIADNKFKVHFLTKELNATYVIVLRNTFKLTVQVSGLNGSLKLESAGKQITITENKVATLSEAMKKGSKYSLAVATGPTHQKCLPLSAAGTITDDTTLPITCTNLYSVAGTVTGLSGSVTLGYGNGQSMTLSGNGVFTLAAWFDSGHLYNVTIANQPAQQSCSVANGAGTVAAANISNIAVTCQTTVYSVRGSVTGLSNGTLVLQNNGGNNLSLTTNGNFTFTTKLPTGAAYAVSVLTNPGSQVCNVTNNSGTMGAADVTNVAVSCASPGLDTSFGGGAGFIALEGDMGQESQIINLLLHSSGRVYGIGAKRYANGWPHRIWALTADGVLDTTFNATGYLDTSTLCASWNPDLIEMPNGDILYDGTDCGTNQGRIMRISPSGVPVSDNTYSNPQLFSLPSRMFYDSGTDRLTVFGIYSTASAWRVNASTYAVDTTWGSSGLTPIPVAGDRAINTVQIPGGGGWYFNEVNWGNLRKVNADGTLDATFNTNADQSGGYETDPYSVPTIDSNGKIYVGYAQGGAGWDDMQVVRYNTDGTKDATFGTGGILTQDYNSYTWESAIYTDPQANGKILVVSLVYYGTGYNIILRRFNADQSVDTTFHGTGFYDTGLSGSGTHVYAVAKDAQGRLIIAGRYGGSPRLALVARIIP